MHIKNYKIVTVFVGFSAVALVLIAMQMLTNGTLENGQTKSVRAQPEADSINMPQESMRYTAYEGKYQINTLDKNGEDFFNKAVSGIVINQWRADTVPNVRACGAEWRDSETFKSLCLGLYDTMIVELDIGPTHAINKILVPVHLKKSVAIGDQVFVVTGSFDAAHETGLLPSITTSVNTILHEPQSG